MFEKPGESLQTVTKVVFVIGIIALAIVSLILLIDLLDEFDILTFLLLIIIDVATVFALYAQCLLFACLGKIAENTSNIEYRVFSKKSKQSSEKVEANQWQCKKCGKIMPDYVGSCGCGNTQRENKYL